MWNGAPWVLQKLPLQQLVLWPLHIIKQKLEVVAEVMARSVLNVGMLLWVLIREKRCMKCEYTATINWSYLILTTQDSKEKVNALIDHTMKAISFKEGTLSNWRSLHSGLKIHTAMHKFCHSPLTSYAKMSNPLDCLQCATSHGTDDGATGKILRFLLQILNNWYKLYMPFSHYFTRRNLAKDITYMNELMFHPTLLVSSSDPPCPALHACAPLENQKGGAGIWAY